MIVNKISDLIVFQTLKNLRHGFLEIKNFDGEVFKFGDVNDQLKARIKIKHPSLNYNLIRNGSVGLAERYMQGYFETDNLSNLIEITAKNIKLIYKFSGILDFSAIHFEAFKFWIKGIKFVKKKLNIKNNISTEN